MDTPDEIRELRFRENNPDEFIKPETECCEMCLEEKEDCRKGVRRGFVCPDCLKNGEAVETYLSLYSEKEVSNWLESLKIK